MAITVDKIIEHLIETPSNSNPNVLKGMLEQLQGGDNPDLSHITATADKFRRSAMRRREEARKRAEEQKLEGTAQRPTNTQVDTEEIRNLLAVSTERQLLSEQAGSGAVSAQTPAPAKKKKRKLM